MYTIYMFLTSNKRSISLRSSYLVYILAFCYVKLLLKISNVLYLFSPVMFYINLTSPYNA